MCLDWDDEDPIDLFGTEIDEEYQRLEVIIAPCNFINREHLGIEDVINSECNYDLEQQK